MHIVQAPRHSGQRRGYARGQETRARIVATALRIFGEHGFERASTRLIAAAAAVNPPALQYYFGGKEGLHRACAQFIIDRATTLLSPALAQAAQAIKARSRRDARAALYRLIDALAVGLADSDAESWRQFIARGKADGAGPAMPMIRDHIGLPLIEATSRLVGLTMGRPQDEQHNRLHALALLAPVNWIHANRDNTLALMGWSELNPQRLELIRQVVHEQAARALGDAPPPARRRRGSKLPR